MIRFEWDPVKAASNRQKHAIQFEEAMHVFADPFAIFEHDRLDDSGEVRWRAIGAVGTVAVVLVAHTVRNEAGDEVIRIISARRATRKERYYYEQTRSQDLG